jgi:hypothetical protein
VRFRLRHWPDAGLLEPDRTRARYLFCTSTYLSVTGVTAPRVEAAVAEGLSCFAIEGLSIQLNFESSRRWF